MTMTTFRLLLWLKGWVHLADGLALLLSFGFWSPSWTTSYGLWMMDMDN
jgi:hypothetical protein